MADDAKPGRGSMARLAQEKTVEAVRKLAGGDFGLRPASSAENDHEAATGADQQVRRVDALTQKTFGDALNPLLLLRPSLAVGGAYLVEPDRVEMAADLMERAGYRLTLPHDAMVAPAIAEGNKAHVVKRDAIPPDEAMLDIGPDSAVSYARAIAAAKTIIWNGPMGVFETPPFDHGTNAVALAMVEATKKGATTIVGGGDSAAAVEAAGLSSAMSHVSTGGGASLEFLEGKVLPGVAALDTV